MVKTRQRLSREDWVRAGYAALESRGIEAVEVEPLARALHVSKGSFYWHFRDRAALLDALLDHWSRQSGWFRLESERSDRASEKLERLAEAFAAAAGQKADRAMMRWAQADPRIAPRVSVVLKRRLAYVAELLSAHGLPLAEATWRAQVISFAFMGWLERTGPAGPSKPALRAWLRRLIALALAPVGARSWAESRSTAGATTGSLTRSRRPRGER
jgi:AcrR family transcriptional regulator